MSEQQIGVRVFGRTESYNPGDDSIVRASARQLRNKLKEYFESEGSQEPIILEIPKGAYMPAFNPRPVPVASYPPRTPLRLWAVISILAAVALWLAVERSGLHNVPVEPESLFGEFLKQATGPVRFVLTDSALAAMATWRDDPVAIDQYASREFIEEGARRYAGNADMLRAWRDIGQRQIPSLAEVGVLTKLYQLYPSAVRRSEIRRARHMQTRDFKSGNSIITGSLVSNPWASLFDAGLNFQFGT